MIVEEATWKQVEPILKMLKEKNPETLKFLQNSTKAIK